jgi:hypothetical protein
MKAIAEILVRSWRPLSDALLMLTIIYILAPGLFAVELPDPTTNQILIAVGVYLAWSFASGFIGSALRHLVGTKVS